MRAKRRFFLTLLLALATSGTYPQNAVCQILYGRWKSSAFHHFGSIDPKTGQRVTMASIPRSLSFSVAAASNTLDPIDSVLYFVARDNWLYSIDMETGGVGQTLSSGDPIVWLNYAFDSQQLYARWKSNHSHNFGSIDTQTGQRTTIASIPRSPSFSVATGSNTLDPISNVLYFYGSGGSLYSISMETGGVSKVSSPGDPFVWLEYSPNSQRLYGRWKSVYYNCFGTVDPQTGHRATIARIPRSPSLSVGAFSNTLDPVNDTMYFRVTDSGYWLYSIDMETGSMNRTLIHGDPLVWLDAVPEPGTLILLSIGGLALLRKRRQKSISCV